MASSNLPPVWRFSYEDYSGLGSVFQKFIANLNLFTLAMYNLMNGGIGFPNMQRAIYTTTVTAAVLTPLVFVNPLPVIPSGVAVVQVLLDSNISTPITSVVSAANWFYDGRNVNIINITGLTVGLVYQISVEVM